MTAYINTLTLEYPKHIGDIQLESPSTTENDLLEEWQAVTPVDRPVYDYETQIAYELPPIQIDNIWYMQWAIRELTQQELKERTERLKLVTNFNQFSTNINAPGSAPNVIE
jgi:hypothetical protein